ncbi:MAG TPA: SGNH/GDSL hydrolase family protein [Leptolyngbyaceae cyanobacterium]
MSSVKLLDRFTQLLWTAAIPLSLSVLNPLAAEAATFNKIVVFGDSLSDAGNTFAATKGLVPPPLLPTLGPGGQPVLVPAYEKGRFTENLNWIDYLAPQLGVSSVQNFAFTSATTGTLNTAPIPGLPGLQQQIGAFVAGNPTATADGLFIVWAGNNDYLQISGQTNPSIPVENLANAIRALASVGAKNILVPNLEDLGKTPLVKSRTNAAQVSDLINQHNSLLAATLTSLEQDPTLGGVNLISLDVFSLFNEALAQPQKFGFTNVDSPCLTNSPLFQTTSPFVTKCDNPDEYLFWDSLHPSDKTHQILAATALETLEQDHASVPEPSPVLAFAVLSGALVLVRWKRSYQL